MSVVRAGGVISSPSGLMVLRRALGKRLGWTGLGGPLATVMSAGLAVRRNAVFCRFGPARTWDLFSFSLP